MLRSPLLHFLAIGALLFGAQRLFFGASPSAPERVIHVSAAQVERLARTFGVETGRSPTASELEGSIAAWVDEELLFREALALGWNRSDPVVQRRLIRNLQFAEGPESGDAAQHLARAFELGMDRSDVVVRRRLVERVKLAIAAAAREREPDDAELEALRRSAPERFRREPGIRLTQVFLSRDRRGDSLEDDARALLAELESGSVAPEQAVRLGDPLLVPARLPLSTQSALARRLGAEFARTAAQAEPGRWSGPVPSSYGLHLVWVHERRPAVLPPLAEIRRELRADWLAEQESAALRRALARLRADTEVRRDQEPDPRLPGNEGGDGC
jgi:hypothetical protein